MKNKFFNIFFPSLIIAIVGILAWKNYSPGTILSGWDTLHPEFNFPLYLNRIFFGAWQEHQGIGAPAAQAFASELTRIPFVYLFSLVLPMNLIRYVFIFLTMLVGSLGTYFLSSYLLLDHGGSYKRAASFLAAIFYVLNLAALQQYLDPLEMFAVHFASLPWLILFSVKYIKDGKRGSLIWFSFITLLATSMANTATLFYVYFGAYCLFIVFAAILNWKKQTLKRGVLLTVLTILLNLFWLAPNIYYVVKESGTVENSKISRTFSDEAYLQSRSFGNLKSLGILKNFPFNWREFDYSTNSFEDLTRVWDQHLEKPFVQDIGYGAVIFAAAGFFVAIFRKSRFAIALLPILLISAFLWLMGIPDKLSILKEALRFPFTKVSIMLISVLSVYLAFSSQLIMQILGKIKLGFIFVIFGILALVYFMLPAFKGNFIDPAMRVKIPDEYFQAFKWFDAQDHTGRVAKLPLQTFWDWNYYSWGYQGGGFTWFGIPQPTLDREFDRWGLYNEDFYFQASNALYGNDPYAFYLALKKYQVKYLLLDESVINPGGSPSLLYISQLKDLIAKSDYVHESAHFGFLTIYETNFDVGKSFVSAPGTQIKNTLPTLTKTGLLYDEDLSINHGFPNAYNCDLKKIGEVTKQNSGKGIFYTADGGGVSCDYLNYPSLKYNQNYILHIAGENLEGRSLKIYFTNYSTSRADLEELLPNGKFDVEYPVYASKLDGSGYSLNFETRSYGNVSSENLLTKVEVYSATPSATISNGEYEIQNSLIVKSVQKFGTWAYKVDLRSIGPQGPEDVQDRGLIQLGQGYEDGWIGITKLNGKWQVLQHFKFNDWSNAWVVPSGSPLPFTIYLVYWPQLLEWGGAFMGLIALVLALTLFP